MSTTPRLQLVQHLGLATAHAARTDPGWIEECRSEIALALVALAELDGRKDPVLASIERVIAGEG